MVEAASDYEVIGSAGADSDSSNRTASTRTAAVGPPSPYPARTQSVWSRSGVDKINPIYRT